MWATTRQHTQETTGENFTVTSDADASSSRLVSMLKWGAYSSPPIATPLTVRIIAPSDSGGTMTDAAIYHRLIGGSYIVFVDMDRWREHPDVERHADVNIYVEHLVGVHPQGSQGSQPFPSTYKWLMVNQDMIRQCDIDMLHRVDKFLCKSMMASRVLDLPQEKVVYTRHTSSDVLSRSSDVLSRSSPQDDDIPPKDYTTFVHFAGKSWVKNTEEVLRTWVENNGLRELGSPRLVITCKGRCLRSSTYLQRELASFFNEPSANGLRRHRLYPNILYAEAISDDEYARLQSTAGFYLCPSQTEGYGHYINEGRSAGAIILTTDVAPMNELVDERNGILIPTNGHAAMCTQSPNLCHYVDVKDIYAAVRRAMSIPLPDRENMSRRSRERYLEDRTYLVDTLSKLFTNERK